MTFPVRPAAIWTNSCIIMGDDIIVAGTMNTVVFCDMPGRNVHIF